MFKKSTLASLMLSVMVFLSMGAKVSAQSCNSKLDVYKERDTRSADVNAGTQFKFQLTNSSNTSKTFTVASVQPTKACVSGKISSKPAINAPLDVSFLSQDRKPGNKIVVPARKTVIFKAVVNVPPGTPVGNTACLEVQATADGCTDGALTTNVYVIISDPSEN